MAKEEIEIKTSEGTAKAGLFMPEAGASRAGVILYMDAFGLRPALDVMAQRICREGYTVLVPDLFYRFGQYGPYDARTAFQNEASAKEIRHIIAETTQEMTQRDTGAFLAALDQGGASGPIATVGYCMGGARALNAAAAYPGRILAAASFHGGNLASDTSDSPHLKAASIKARVYVGMAGVDRSFPPEQSTRFADAFRAAEVDFAMENYVGMQHGWAVPDHSVFDEAGAERHWRRLLCLLSETLR